MMQKNIAKATLHGAAIKALPLALMLAMGAAQAQDTDSMFSYSGFGTVGAVHSSSNSGDFVSTLYQSSGPGVSRSWDINTDTKLGVQVSAKISDQLTAVVQVVSAARSNNTFAPRFEWANLQYAFTPDLKVRVGRTALATFMLSDTRLVGYANTWMRPPVDVYSNVPMTNLDGVDLTYRSRFGRATNTLQVFAGKTDIHTVGPEGEFLPATKIRRARGLSNSVEIGSWTLRAGYLQSDVLFDLVPIFVKTVPLKEYSLGALYDTGEWFVQGEFTHLTLPTFAPPMKSGYLTAGYRFGNFTPYAIYAKSVSGKEPALLAFDQNTASVGVRWDAMKNIAVKLQFDQVQPRKGNVGYLIKARPGLTGSNVRLVGLAVDFVF